MSQADIPLLLIGYRADWRPRKPVLGIVPDRTPTEGYKPSTSEWEKRDCLSPHCDNAFRVRASSPQRFCSFACGKGSDVTQDDNDEEP